MFRLEGSKARKQSQESDYSLNRGERPICFSHLEQRQQQQTEMENNVHVFDYQISIIPLLFSSF